MIISPISIVSENSNNLKLNASHAFKSAPVATTTSFVVDDTSRRVGMIGSSCLSVAVGLLSGGLTACLTDSKVKPAIVGVLLAGLIGFLSWPSKKDYN